jgi:hypothetical protein
MPRERGQSLARNKPETTKMTREQALLNASKYCLEHDDMQVVGKHPIHGWVHRSSEDMGGIAELLQPTICYVTGEGEIIESMPEEIQE